LSLAGPLLRFGPERRPELARLIAAAAEELGGIWPLRFRGGSGSHAPPVSAEERDHERDRIAAL
jgi:hypothetical protein